jgi:hypothetical protein
MIKGGPKIINDSLVACLDAHDAKSYAGEPVTNLVTSSAVDFSVRSAYSGNTFSQVVDNESPSGYACEMSYTGTVNSSSRSRFGAATNIPTSGTGFVSIWAKKSAGPSTTMRPKVYTGTNWYVLEPLDGGSDYFTNEYRPFGAVVTFGTNSGGPNPGFSMTHGGNTTANDKTRWIKPQVTTLSYNVPFANLSRSATDGWKDLSTNDHDGSLLNGTNTGVNYYRDGQVIMPVANSYLDFDGTDDQVIIPSLGSSYSNYSLEFWIAQNGTPSSSRFYSWNAGGTFTVRYISSPQSFQFHYNPLDGSPSTTSVNGNSLSDTVNGIWHHVVVTNNSSVGAIVYTDGVAGATGEAAVALNNGHILGTGYAGINPTNCKIAKFNIYNTDLTAAEILSNYNATKNRFT